MPLLGEKSLQAAEIAAPLFFCLFFFFGIMTVDQ